MFNDGRASVLTFQFSLGTVLSNHSAWQVKYHITQWASISAKIPIFQNLRGFMEKSTRASMCNCLPICRSFFSLFHIACLGSILLFLVIAQLCPLIYCIRNLLHVLTFFLLRRIFLKNFWASFSQNYMHFGSEYSHIYHSPQKSRIVELREAATTKKYCTKYMSSYKLLT